MEGRSKGHPIQENCTNESQAPSQELGTPGVAIKKALGQRKVLELPQVRTPILS